MVFCVLRWPASTVELKILVRAQTVVPLRATKRSPRETALHTVFCRKHRFLSITTTRNRAKATMATNEADALVSAWCAALPYPAEDLVGTANDAWAVPQTSQTALGASVAASLSTLSADAAEAALPRWHDASLAAAATTYCVDAAAALDGVYRAREAALHARRELEAAATEAAATRTNGEPETGRGLAAEALARADAARAAARAVELSVEACCGTLAALAKEEDASLGEAPRRFARAARAAVEAIAARADDRAAACLKDASVLEGLVDLTWVRDRKALKVDAVACVRGFSCFQSLVEDLRHEGKNRSQEPGERCQNFVESFEGDVLVRIVFGAPKASPRPTNIPICKVVDKP